MHHLVLVVQERQYIEMIPDDPIERLVNLPILNYKEALAILFVNYAKMPTAIA